MRSTKFVESYFDAWNQHDPKAVADHLSEEGTYLDVPENQQRSQHELINSLSDFFANFDLTYELIGDILAKGNSIAFQYRMCPGGNLDSPLCSASFNGAEFMTLNGNAALSIIDFYDMPLATPAAKYAKSGLAGEQMAEYKRRLDWIMQSQQEFLSPDLTLPKLAQIVDCSVNHLSQVINSGFGMSFFDYLNNYRIEHAKVLLAEKNNRDNAILNIAFRVGFNSNSAFYTAFKKNVGQTPAQYRRRAFQAEG